MIEIQHLNRLFSNGEGLRDISLSIRDGEKAAIIGASGSGKSTLIRCLNLLEMPESGSIVINGQDLTDPDIDMYAIRRRLGIVFQSPTLFQHKMLIENVMMGMVDLMGYSRQDAYEEARQYLEMVGLGERLKAYPDELSPGQQQRGQIARCLAMKPEILFLDEPTASLDAAMAGEVHAVLRRLADEGMTMVFATHDFSLIRKVAGRVIYMEHGRVLEDGTPDEILLHPKRQETKAFVQLLRKLIYRISSKNFDLYELNAKIESFGRDYFLSKDMIRRTELVIEELILHSILAHTNQIQLEIEYFETEQRVEITVRYGGNQMNPFNSDTEDALSMLLVRQMTEHVSYEYEHENILHLQIRSMQNHQPQER